MFGSWTISGALLLKSGTPFPVFAGSDAPGFGNVDGENGDRVHVALGHACFVECPPDDRDYEALVVPRCQLRDHASVKHVHVLGRHDRRRQRAFDRNRRGGVVTRRFDAEHRGPFAAEWHAKCPVYGRWR